MTGANAVEGELSAGERQHRRAVEKLTSLAEYYPDGYLEDLREGWPE
ncbi:hypothetical protein GCM10025864_16820 [Luteimicrobium album]|uniref:Uncharacterized protein n=1 Tax=Luteimicrobium album TaxID=1054550 RepID=A0ABQ6HZM0_9MICO|nr:hypothetical protein [Luteimicrobium album]GMA23923.1 hypothetical protein GCM10025864_16820 [Luteimicrobium album]